MGSKGSSPFVYVVVLACNRKNDTVACLRSLESVWDEKTKGLLVDNGSTDGTYDAVRGQYPHLEIVQTGENLGFTGGNNVGIRHALKMGADYIVLLNNDTVVDPGFVREMLTVAISSDVIGFVSPKIYFQEPPDVIWFAGARFYSWCGYGRMVGYRERDQGQYDQVREIDRPCGCTVMVSRRLCEEVGLMDPSLFMYVDEIEWKLRANKKGFKAFFAPKALVWHKVSASGGQECNLDAMYYGVRNTLHAINSHEPLTSALLRDLRNLMVVMVFLFSAFKLRSAAREGFRAVLEGVRDYKISRMGRRGSGISHA